MRQDEFEVLIIEPGGEHRVEKLGRGCEPLQRLVGGYIEATYVERGDVTFWINEEGKLNGLEPNPVGTALWYQGWPNHRIEDILVGTVVISGGADDQGETLSIPTGYRDKVLAQLAEGGW
jgi:hypothetical protein